MMSNLRMRAMWTILLVLILILQLQWSYSSQLTQRFVLAKRSSAKSARAPAERSLHTCSGILGMGGVKLSGCNEDSVLLNLRGGNGVGSISFVQSLSLHQSKILMQVALTIFNILCWALPLCSTSFTQNSALLSYANAFAGGIFLMLSFQHLLPEAVRSMAAGVSGEGTHVIVYALAGYMAMLFIEKVAFVTHTTSDDIALVNAGYTPMQQQHSSQSHSIYNSGGKDTLQQSLSVGQNHVDHSNRQNSAIALCCAMSVHSFFEAAALGLATDRTAACMMSACIALHQPAESVALLVAFLKSGMSRRNMVLWLTAFSLVSLGGMLAGLLVTSLASATMESVVMAITAGTFIYVGATEIANEEFEGDLSGAQRLLRYTCYAGGMATMFGIAALSKSYE